MQSVANILDRQTDRQTPENRDEVDIYSEQFDKEPTFRCALLLNIIIFLPHVNSFRSAMVVYPFHYHHRPLPKSNIPTSHRCHCFCGRPPSLRPLSPIHRYARGVEKARFPSELHDAMACLDVAKAHLSAQQLFHRGPTIAV